MGIIVAFFCGLCFSVLADAIADYIYAKAEEIEARTEIIKLNNLKNKQAAEE